MACEIIWTENAREDLKNIFTYLQQEWSSRIAENFLVECYSKIDLIAHFPYIGVQSEKINSVRRILVTKHNALFYKVERKNIILLDFFDTRQQPDKSYY